MPAKKYHTEEERRLAKQEASLRWIERNRERRREIANAWNRRNRDRVNEVKAEYRERNAEEISRKFKEWRSANLDRLDVYRKERRHRHSEIQSQRRSRTPPWCDREACKVFYEIARRASKCTGIKFHVDHIYPLLGKNSCGLHVPWNLRVIPAIANIKKGNKVPK